MRTQRTRTSKTPVAPKTMNDELKRKLKDLRLGGLLAHWMNI